jgi:hypothetical protein
MPHTRHRALLAFRLTCAARCPGLATARKKLESSLSSRANQENNPMADQNRQWSTATDGNQDDTSRKLGIPIDTTRPNDTAPGILPTNNGSLRATPTDHFVSTPRGNRAGK